MRGLEADDPGQGGVGGQVLLVRYIEPPTAVVSDKFEGSIASAGLLNGIEIACQRNITGLRYGIENGRDGLTRNLCKDGREVDEEPAALTIVIASSSSATACAASRPISMESSSSGSGKARTSTSRPAHALMMASAASLPIIASNVAMPVEYSMRAICRSLLVRLFVGWDRNFAAFCGDRKHNSWRSIFR